MEFRRVLFRSVITLYQFIYGICDIVLNNPKFISEIFHFEFFDYLYSLSYNKSFETFLSSFTSPIKHIGFCSKNLEVKKNFTNIIQRTQLSSITFWHFGVSLFDSLKYLSNTLTSINFDRCKFSNSMSFDTST